MFPKQFDCSFYFSEKVYNRQISAPMLKRKSSRFGLGQFLSGSSNANTANVATTQTHHHLQISSTPHYQTHHSYHTPHSSSAGTTPTTPNIMTDKQYQYHQQTQGPGGTNVGATGRSLRSQQQY